MWPALLLTVPALFLPAVRLPPVTQFDGTPRARVHMADEVTREQILKDLAEYEDIRAEDLLAELRVVQAQAAASEAVFAVASAGAVFAGARAASMSSKMSREQKEDQSTAPQAASLTTRGSFLAAAATGLAGAALGLFFGRPAGDQTEGATSGTSVPADGALVARLQRSEEAREVAESKLQALAVCNAACDAVYGLASCNAPCGMMHHATHAPPQAALREQRPGAQPLQPQPMPPLSPQPLLGSPTLAFSLAGGVGLLVGAAAQAAVAASMAVPSGEASADGAAATGGASASAGKTSAGLDEAHAEAEEAKVAAEEVRAAAEAEAKAVEEANEAEVAAKVAAEEAMAKTMADEAMATAIAEDAIAKAMAQAQAKATAEGMGAEAEAEEAKVAALRSRGVEVVQERQETQAAYAEWAAAAEEEARAVEEAGVAAEEVALEEARAAAEEARMAAEADAVEEARAAAEVELAAEVEAAEGVRMAKEVKVAAARGVSAGVDPLSSLSPEDRRYLALKLTDYSRESFLRLRGGFGSSVGGLRQAAERRRAPPGDGMRRGWQPASDGTRTRGVTMEMAARPPSAQAVAARERLLADLEQYGAGPGCKAAPSALPPAAGAGAGVGALFAGGASSTALTLLSAGAALAGARAVLEGSRLERERRELEQEREEQRERKQQWERERENGGERGGDPNLVSPALLMQLQLAEALAAARQSGTALRGALLAREAGIAAAEERAEAAEAARSRLTLGYAAAAATKEEELAAAQLRLFEQAERLEAGRRAESAGLVAPQLALPWLPGAHPPGSWLRNALGTSRRAP